MESDWPNLTICTYQVFDIFHGITESNILESEHVID